VKAWATEIDQRAETGAQVLVVDQQVAELFVAVDDIALREAGDPRVFLPRGHEEAIRIGRKLGGFDRQDRYLRFCHDVHQLVLLHWRQDGTPAPPLQARPWPCHKC